MTSSTWFAFVHMLVNLPLGILYFVLVITGSAVGFGLLVTLMGIPILIGTGWLVRTLGNVERARMNGFLGTNLRDPYRRLLVDSGWQVVASVGDAPALMKG